MKMVFNITLRLATSGIPVLALFLPYL